MLKTNTTRIPFFLTLIAGLIIVASACDDNGFNTVTYDEIGPYDTTGVQRFESDQGLIIYFHEEGDGDIIAESHDVRIRYTGRTPDGEIFDSSFRNGVDSPTTLRVGGMVRGFIQGLAGVPVDGQRMHAAREGSQRTLVIPPELGYGNSSHQLNEDTLIFDIDVVSITSD
ncbi:FKBP-type peptidyl-prolyl cis-trans isomerase [Natronogracilivirga saccharolytica]|uniref:Peptidyl-prolyl cis-trans isomerase n=1 Tax=Natronogracilivirga saccharolytica TaxID=2812953 RepID=A0A8J7RPI8_9BACT|nr:FKBP-type peptidyl-prolyl cis-trans isomerase [Natronogracilivirga saccharolytica]MBP3193803.1 FKBP-type peptidyl-prolyl cis-trans isomerase [Natronogracilivirga saccharolytica]